MMSRTLVLVACTLALSCGKKSPAEPSGPGAPTTISGYVSQAVTLSAAQTTSTTRTGAPPAAGGGPSATVISPNAASSGGANLLTVLGSAPFRCCVARTSAQAAADGCEVSSAGIYFGEGCYNPAGGVSPPRKMHG